METYVGFKILLTVVLINFVASKPYDIGSILKSIPEEDRVQFLKHHIQIGYELAQNDHQTINLPEMNVPELPEEFSVALYEYTRQEHRIQNNALVSVLGNIICFPNGECIDVGDVGVHPRNLDNK